MTDKKHVHKLKKIRYKSGNQIFFCTLPDCTYKINPVLALGKRSICWRCGEEFILTDYSLKLVKPHCENCHKSKKEVINIKEAERTIEKISESLADKLEQELKNAQKEMEEEI